MKLLKMTNIIGSFKTLLLTTTQRNVKFTYKKFSKVFVSLAFNQSAYDIAEVLS